MFSLAIGYCCCHCVNGRLVLDELNTYINKCIFILRIFSLVFMFERSQLTDL